MSLVEVPLASGPASAKPHTHRVTSNERKCLEHANHRASFGCKIEDTMDESEAKRATICSK